jgi:hypothetical protein
MRKVVFILLAALLCLSAQAQKVVTLRRTTETPTVKVEPEHHPTRSLRLAVGTRDFVTAAFNYYISPSFMIGGGMGYGCIYFNVTHSVPAYQVNRTNGVVTVDARKHENVGTGWGIPFYFESELRTPAYRWSPFLNMKMGATVGLFQPYYEEGRSYYATDATGNAVYSTTTVQWQPFFASVAAGISYKCLNLGCGIGVQGTRAFGTLFLSANIPLSE